MLTIRMFGPFQALRDGIPLAGLSLRASQLLAFLLLKSDRDLSKNWVADNLWMGLDLLSGEDCEEDRQKRQGSFRQALADLNRALETLPEIVVESGYGTIRLCLKEGDVDLLTFDAALARGKRGDPDAYEAACAQCESGVRNRLLEGWEEVWIETEREWRSQEYLRALTTLAARDRQRKQYRQAAYYGGRAVAEAPERIASWLALMEDYLNAGEPIAAIKVYKRFCAHYGKLLHKGQAEPDRRLQEMLRQAERMLQMMGVASAAEEPLEPAGGGLATNSRVYQEREEDALFHNAIARHDGLALVKGPRQVGKTSLLARGRTQAQLMGARIAWTDLQSFDEATFATPNTLFHALGRSLEDDLEPAMPLEMVWNPDYPPHENLARYLQRHLLPEKETPVVWFLDEVDRLFACPFKNDVFGWFRALYNRRQSSAPAAPLRRLILIFAYATEARLLITDPNMSPFNVGTHLSLSDFTSAQVAELNSRYHSPLRSPEEVERYIALVGGHPYLVCRGLFEMASRSMTLEDFDAQADSGTGIFADHLHRLHALLTQNPPLMVAALAAGIGKPCPITDSFLRLQSGGVLIGEPEHPRFRCGLYRRFLEKRL